MYERELIGLIQAVKHWHPYLWGCEFVVQIDDHNLKYLLDQRLSTIPQHHWATKLLGHDFQVEFKLSVTNVVADPISQGRGGSGGMHCPVCSILLFLR